MSASTELRVKELLKERGWTTKVLAEKTGMSESYLTHIKNGTRRWNEDALRKLANAFDVQPIDLFAQRRKRVVRNEETIQLPEEASELNFQIKAVPVMGEIPSSPSPYNNQITQMTTGYKDVFVPVFNSKDESMFCLSLENNAMAPRFMRGDCLVISPATWVHSGEIAAVEYGNDAPVRAILQVTYVDDFVLLESVNHKQAPVALIRGKDHFRVIGKLVHRYQKLG